MTTLEELSDLVAAIYDLSAFLISSALTLESQAPAGEPGNALSKNRRMSSV
jgi:hypothetical protein